MLKLIIRTLATQTTLKTKTREEAEAIRGLLLLNPFVISIAIREK